MVERSIKLVKNDGDSMYVCRTDDLNLQQFEIDNDYDVDDEISIADVAIQNLAENLIGEHNCFFDKIPNGLKSNRLILTVTTEANAHQQSNNNIEFKAELYVMYAGSDRVLIDGEISISCPKSGEFKHKIY